MKKLLMSSIVLTVFSLSIVLFQYSCQKEAMAQRPDMTKVLDISLLAKDVIIQTGSTDTSGVDTPIMAYSKEYYTINNDGTNLTKINIPMPPGYYARGKAFLTPDGLKLVFEAAGNGQFSIFSVLRNGTNLTKIFEENAYQPLALQETY